MWLARPVYELLPYFYMLLGLVLVAASFWVNVERWSSWLLGGGGLALLVGLVLWLKRKDYRKAQSEYNRHSLDE
jgi:hypothetical protein